MAELFLKILNMSISASWVVLAVLVLRLILKKAPKWVGVLLWGIVAVRLLCPVSIESIFSLIPSAETISPDIMMDATPTIHTGIDMINSSINPVISEAFTPDPVASANPLQIWIPVLAVFWLAGTVAMLLYAAISYWHLRRKVQTAVRFQGNLFQSEAVSSPFILGIIKPKIYLPFRMNGQTREYVIAHETVHLRRKDHWWKPLGFLLLAIHWFNPLMWLAYALLCRDIELACDEKVIKKLECEQRADYSEALLVCSVNRRMIAACPLAFGEVGVRVRVKNVLNYKKPGFWIILASILLCIVGVVCFLTDPVEKRDTIQWAQNLSPENVSSADLVVLPQSPDKQFKTLTDDEIRIMAELISESDGHYQKNHEELDGGSIFFYITMEDGSTHSIGNIGNTYLVIDGEYFEAEYAWLTTWDDDFGEGNAALPDQYFASTITDTRMSADIIPGTTYVPYQCLYMNPLSSFFAFGGDSGYKYVAQQDSFTIVSRNENSITMPSDADIIDTASSGTQYSIPVKQWQEFPFTDKEWASLYQPSISVIQNISQYYTQMLYQPLTQDLFLLQMDGDLWLVELRKLNKMGTCLWSIYSLVPEVSMGVAQWEYAPMLSSRSPVFLFAFDMDHSEITAVCTDSSLVDFDAANKPTGTSLAIQEGNALYWSPVDKNGSTVSNATIHFTVHQGDLTPYHGTIYITGTDPTDGRRIYTASLVGTGLHLSPNAEAEGGIISVVDTTNQVIEYDLRAGEYEIAADDLNNCVFFTNSEKISVAVEKGGDFEGELVLLDVSQGNAEIQYAAVSSKDNTCLFTGLTSARLYRISCVNIDNCTLIVSDNT